MNQVECSLYVDVRLQIRLASTELLLQNYWAEVTSFSKILVSCSLCHSVYIIIPAIHVDIQERSNSTTYWVNLCYN